MSESFNRAPEETAEKWFRETRSLCDLRPVFQTSRRAAFGSDTALGGRFEVQTIGVLQLAQHRSVEADPVDGQRFDVRAVSRFLL